MVSLCINFPLGHFDFSAGSQWVVNIHRLLRDMFYSDDSWDVDYQSITGNFKANFTDFSCNLHDFDQNNKFTAVFTALNCLKLFMAQRYLPVNIYHHAASLPTMIHDVFVWSSRINNYWSNTHFFVLNRLKWELNLDSLSLNAWHRMSSTFSRCRCIASLYL